MKAKKRFAMTVGTLLDTQLSVSIVAGKIRFPIYQNTIIGYGLIILIVYNGQAKRRRAFSEYGRLAAIGRCFFYVYFDLFEYYFINNLHIKNKVLILHTY